MPRCTRSIAAARPDIVFHLAAQPLVRRSYGQPAETFETNVLGTVNLLEAVRSTDSVKAVVVVTSDKCYENAEWPWGYRETDPLGGHDPYSASKACAEIVCAAYQRSFFENTESNASLATVRAGNVIGGGDWSDDRIVPDAIKAFTRGIPLLVRNPALGPAVATRSRTPRRLSASRATVVPRRTKLCGDLELRPSRGECGRGLEARRRGRAALGKQGRMASRTSRGRRSMKPIASAWIAARLARCSDGARAFRWKSPSR